MCFYCNEKYWNYEKQHDVKKKTFNDIKTVWIIQSFTASMKTPNLPILFPQIFIHQMLVNNFATQLPRTQSSAHEPYQFVFSIVATGFLSKKQTHNHLYLLRRSIRTRSLRSYPLALVARKPESVIWHSDWHCCHHLGYNSNKRMANRRRRRSLYIHDPRQSRYGKCWLLCDNKTDRAENSR